MATRNHNLSKFDAPLPSAEDMRFGIVVAEWNREVTEALLEGAVRTLRAAGCPDMNIQIKYVPGTFELSLGAQFFAEYTDVDAVIALGCVIQGDTRHFDFICQGVTQGITQLQIQWNMPIAFGVLTVNDMQQALDRCGGITELKYHENGECTFYYCDKNFRHYLTDVGAFLELFIHLCAVTTGKFSSVRSRVKYNWEYSRIRHDRSTIYRPASNEIDVIAINGIEPLFISCKTCAPDMKHIDEIYPQAMRMSGGEGHAVFACTHEIDKDMPIYNKAKALGVYIIDGDDIKNRLVTERLIEIAEDRYVWKDEPEYKRLIK